jgi:hypothetical protein
MTATPNIFRHATKELSQDAFLCWLLEWYKMGIKGPLADCARNFLYENLKQNDGFGSANGIPNDIKISRQYKKIDILVRVGECLLIIEDKTAGALGVDQIKRYHELMEEEHAGQIAVAYFKTGLIGIPDEIPEDVIKSYRPLVWNYKDNIFYGGSCRDIYDFFSQFKSDHPIFRDFVDLLERRKSAYDRTKELITSNPTLDEIKEIFKEESPVQWEMCFLDFISREFRKKQCKAGIKTDIKNWHGIDRSVGIDMNNGIRSDVRMYWREGREDHFVIKFKYLGTDKGDYRKVLEEVQDSLWNDRSGATRQHWKKLPTKNFDESKNRRAREIFETEKLYLERTRFSDLGEYLQRMREMVDVVQRVEANRNTDA